MEAQNESLEDDFPFQTGEINMVRAVDFPGCMSIYPIYPGQKSNKIYIQQIDCSPQQWTTNKHVYVNWETNMTII